jgi:energy-coupling factor transporter ATP-binding protein EcfA2
MGQQFALDLQPTTGTGSLRTTLGRINAILGANGAGKSTAIRTLVANAALFGANRPVIYVEGGRAVVVPDAIEVDQRTFAQYGTLDSATKTHAAKVKSAFSGRIKDALFVLLRRGENLKIEHSDAVSRWISAGKNGDCPILSPLPLQRLFDAFNEVFPEIALSFADGTKRQFRCTKAGSVYQPSKLSDGEKQVLAILADIALLAKSTSVVLVDEPELNLHPSLANRLWERIEADLPDATFVYATHSIGFALRPTVDKVIVLGTNGRETMELSDLRDLPPAEAREFLGAIPAILASNAALVAEGDNDASFDGLLYRWLAPDRKAEVICLGGCGDVQAATTRTGVWDRLAPQATVVGVVDRDFRSDSTLDLLAPCLVLGLHEAESYLCHPKLLSDLARKLKLVSPLPTEEVVLAHIWEFMKSDQLRIAALRTFSRASLRLGVSIDKKTLRSATDVAGLRNLIGTAARNEADKAHRSIGEAATLDILDAELRRVEGALGSRDPLTMLRLVPGKELLAQLAPRVGCRDRMMLLRAASEHLTVSDYPHLVELQAQLVLALPGE